MSGDGLTMWRRGQAVSTGPIRPRVPAVVMIEPKYPHNVGQAVRIASCYGIEQVWYSGRRVALTTEAGARLPREERMRGYADVTLARDDNPLDVLIKANIGCTPVAVELLPHAERLPDFEHPKRAVYVFGPEDGSLRGDILKCCHRFVSIPSLHCLNLATSIGIVLYDRAAKGGAEFTVANEHRRELAVLAAMPDDQIDTSDIPEADEEWFRMARLRRQEGQT